MSRDVRWLNIIWKHYRKKSIYARKQVELFLNEEEKSIEDERSFGESSIEEGVTEVDNLQGVPPTAGEGETMVTP